MLLSMEHFAAYLHSLKSYVETKSECSSLYRGLNKVRVRYQTMVSH